MAGKYYSEDVVRFSPWREEYQATLDEYLQNQKQKAESVRAEFITPQKYKADPTSYHERFIQTLGFPLTQARETPTLYKKEYVATDGNVRIYRMQLLFFGTVKFYGIYFEQTENKESAPFIIAQHGGGDSAEIVSSIYGNGGTYKHLARRMTDKGANVFAPQLLLWRDDPYGSTHDRLATDGKLRQLGGSMTALEVYLLRGSIDYFIQNEGINADRVGVAGLSYGGLYALHLAAVDERVKACYSCSWVNDCYVHSRADWSYINAQNTFAVAETAALIAPRALVVAMGDKDELFDYKITQAECARVRPYYQIYGKDDKFKTVIFDGTHAVDVSDEEIEFVFENL